MLTSIVHPITGEVLDLTKCVASEAGVPPGRIVIFAGPAACGKTTLLQAAAREALTAGLTYNMYDEISDKATMFVVLRDATYGDGRSPAPYDIADHTFIVVENAAVVRAEYAGCVIHLRRGERSTYGSELQAPAPLPPPL